MNHPSFVSEPDVDAFSHLLFAHLDAEEVALFPPPLQAQYAQEALLTLAERAPLSSKIRLLSTNIDGKPRHILQVVNDDMPFLLDSTLAELNARGIGLLLVAHPILNVERGEDGRLIRLLNALNPAEPPSPSSGTSRESFLHIHFQTTLSPEEQADLSTSLTSIYTDIRAAVTDWRPMREKLLDMAAHYRRHPPLMPTDEIAEAVQFMDWLLADNFTFLGARHYTYVENKLDQEPTISFALGILRDPAVKMLRREGESAVATPEIRSFMEGDTLLFVAKANKQSHIHRRTYLDCIGIKTFDENGEISGELRLVGLFTSTAYTSSARMVPYIRHKVARVVEHAGFDPRSHSGKALYHVLENYPRDELFQIDVPTLCASTRDILALSERPRLRVVIRKDQFDRFVSILVFLPQERYDSRLQTQIADYFSACYGGYVAEVHPSHSDGALTQIHYIIAKKTGKIPSVTRNELEAQIELLMRSWEDDFILCLRKKNQDETQFHTQYTRVKEAFNAAYREAFSPIQAVDDLSLWQNMPQDCPFAFQLIHLEPKTEEKDEKAKKERFSLKIFVRAAPLPLSQRVPILENLGFTVMEESTYPLHPKDEPPVYLHDMEIQTTQQNMPHFHIHLLEEALPRIFLHQVESDRFNSLIVQAGLSVREADILRSYARYMRQIGLPYGQDYIAEALARYAEGTKLLVHFFQQKFDPALLEGQNIEVRKLALLPMKSALLKVIDGIASLDDDRIFRHFLNLLEASLRTNAYQQGRTTIAFKLECTKIESLPKPRPLYEIFIASPRVEGLHLRFGKVARGGLRWSDRPMDFRTEILGLVKAQQVKNAVIVPVGAKGGFFPKNLPPMSDRKAWLEEGTEAYKIFILALLDLTDTLEGAKVIHPAFTLCYDGEDPYLVVAADKGTASFSDLANSLSEARGHWLGDAFASGGSVGYDHKKMAITARGAWEAVKRHFREMDRDIQTSPFTLVGVGDMSGDVFGNGLLLSPEARLIAAFDHRDIFIDPSPDPVISLAERRRLFEKPSSSWQDYNKALLSTGGGIFSRNLKKIPLSPQIRTALALDQEEATPQEVMQAILRAKVDLLWFGGIGTYIRAQDETDNMVGDRANDSIRITGAEIQALVIGEGANLGLTQKGRIEAALRGIRLNTDAIDNSAGVNSSDVEVNLKIAFLAVEGAGQLDRAGRNEMLAAMTDDVAALVLNNNYHQSLALSLAEVDGARANEDIKTLMQNLGNDGRLDRRVEFLPSDAELDARSAKGQGVTRPELAVLLAYAKLALHDRLLESNLPDDPFCETELMCYFPLRFAQSYPEAIATHPLRREIIATALANALINLGGPYVVSRLQAQTGRNIADIVRSYLLTRAIFGLDDKLKQVDALDNQTSGANQIALYRQLRADVLMRMGWFLRNLEASALAQPLNMLATRFQGGLDAVLVAEGAKKTVPQATQILRTIEEFFGLSDLRAQVGNLLITEKYERLAFDRALALTEEGLRRMAIRVLQDFGNDEEAVKGWFATLGKRGEDTRNNILALGAGALSQAKLTVLAGFLSGFFHG